MLGALLSVWVTVLPQTHSPPPPCSGPGRGCAVDLLSWPVGGTHRNCPHGLGHGFGGVMFTSVMVCEVLGHGCRAMSLRRGQQPGW